MDKTHLSQGRLRAQRLCFLLKALEKTAMKTLPTPGGEVDFWMPAGPAGRGETKSSSPYLAFVGGEEKKLVIRYAHQGGCRGNLNTYLKG
jgi:hypothetical protein